MSFNVRNAGNVIAGGIVPATYFDWLPPLAALFTIIWLGIQITDWIRKRIKERDQCAKCKHKDSCSVLNEDDRLI